MPEYIQKHPDADRLGLVGVPPVVIILCITCHQLCGIAKGLHYLHSRNVIHGDLKGVRYRVGPRFMPD